MRAIANRLPEKGIPTPTAGTKRKRKGVDVPVSIAWHPETVKQLLQNPLIIGLQAYGRQSGGTHKRWSLGHRLPHAHRLRHHAACRHSRWRVP